MALQQKVRTKTYSRRTARRCATAVAIVALFTYLNRKIIFSQKHLQDQRIIETSHRVYQPRRANVRPPSHDVFLSDLYHSRGALKSPFDPLSCDQPRNERNGKNTASVLTKADVLLQRKIEDLDHENQLSDLLSWAESSYDIPAMKRDYQRDGYVIFQPIWEGNEVEEAAKLTEHLPKCSEVSQSNLCPPLELWNSSAHGINDAFLFNPSVRAIVESYTIKSVLAALYTSTPYSYQSINFRKSSFAGLHSDWLHFGTYPPDKMCGVWLALEDISLKAGPLQYYRGSHKLPQLSMQDLGLDTILKGDYPKYHERLEAVLLRSGLEKVTFAPKKGQVLIWASNLAHTGPPPVDPDITRLSMVTHYHFNKDIKYAWVPGHSTTTSGRCQGDTGWIKYVNLFNVHVRNQRIPMAIGSHIDDFPKHYYGSCDEHEDGPCSSLHIYTK